MTGMAACNPAQFLWRMESDIAVIQLKRPDRKNPPIFDSHSEIVVIARETLAG